MYKNTTSRLIIAEFSLFASALTAEADEQAAIWPRELVDFVPDERHPVFLPGPADAWDTHLRERGWI